MSIVSNVTQTFDLVSIFNKKYFCSDISIQCINFTK